MVSSVFDSLQYALFYEQDNLNCGDEYGRHAADSIRLANLGTCSNVVDIGCGTGASTCKLIDMLEGARVVGVEPHRMIDIARLKFGMPPLIPEEIFETVKKHPPYPEILRKYKTPRDLESHLRECIAKYQSCASRTNFYQTDASRIPEFLDADSQDLILASQVVHWFRENPHHGNPSSYEGKAIGAINHCLKEGGIFVFNTTSRGVLMSNGQNLEQMGEHPFRRAFKERLYVLLGKTKETGRKMPKKLDDNEIDKIMGENGLTIIAKKEEIRRVEPKTVRENCITGGHMSLFESDFKSSNQRGKTLSMKEREQVLEEALTYAETTCLLEEIDVTTSVVHYVARK
jgi:SAM-dependent methyltransferase